ncbi:4Fe-4S dicluster domain-containing protein [Halodurantibacterium flavum]|uniref:4Fe-4S dicluster domain-containing protein n=1 Tax=Halodurantibacterium flavum TaxID=1382802 RepID=A0ABW4S9T3_9RHOB
MPATPRLILTCSCEGTMPLDERALERAGCGRIAEGATQLCRAQLDRFRGALAEGVPVTVACTQEQPLFEEVAEEHGVTDILFANIRETGGWSADARAAGPKMAALIAAAAEEANPYEITSMESAGVALILGAGDEAVAAAATLADSLDVTVLIVPGATVTPPRRTVFPVLQGQIRKAQGVLGAFELTVDAYAAPAPSSRQTLVFEGARNGAVSRCDLVIDLTGGRPLFPADDLRPGYFRADPRDPVAVAETLRQAAGMVGTFDKPRFISFAPQLCAHSRNKTTGCTRCLDLCPTGAITPAGDTVAIDPNICAGCGQCAAACPTGAASYALPDVESLARRLRTLLRTWYQAGGTVAPVVLLHDDAHGTPLIDASARFGRGLPAHVIPVLVNEVTQIGPEIMAAALAYGAGVVRILTPHRPRHDIGGLEATLDLMATTGSAMGHGAGTIALVQADDPDAMEAALWPPAPAARDKRSSFLAPGAKRSLLTTAFEEMNQTAPSPARQIPLEAGAPFGAVVLDTAACTLCLSCVGVCPTGALADNPNQPMLRFTESACVQCGLCAATCPETAITLEPRIDFDAWNQPRRILKEEEPFCCTSCGKAFGTRSSIERVQAKLSDHWMFAGPAGEARLRVLTMCDDCRVQSVVNDGFDPHEGAPRPRVRTSDDYRN